MSVLQMGKGRRDPVKGSVQSKGLLKLLKKLTGPAGLTLARVWGAKPHDLALLPEKTAQERWMKVSGGDFQRKTLAGGFP